MTSGPIPSPASTAMWKALFADMEILEEGVGQVVIASEAKQSRIFPLRQPGLLRRFALRNDDGESARYGVSTVRPTTAPCCNCTSASLALASGAVVTGIGGTFFVRTRSSSSCVSRKLPT